MIENRYRIETQIQLGRQAVRKAMRPARPTSRTIDDHNAITEGNNSPEPITDIPIIALEDIETPLPVDTDTECVFADKGTAWYFTRGRPTATVTPESGPSTPHGNGNHNYNDPLRSPSLRRKWTSDLLDQRIDVNDVGDRSTTSADPSGLRRTKPPNFFTKFRPKSLSALTIPFSMPHRFSEPNAARPQSPEAGELGWSSDSSSEASFTLANHKYTSSHYASVDGRVWPADPDNGGLE